MSEDELVDYVKMKLEEWQAETGPRTAPALLDAFEEKHAVKLPRLYRRVLSEVGSWDTWDDGRQILGGLEPLRDHPHAGKPFPLVAARNADEIEPAVEEALLGAHGSVTLATEIGCDEVEHFLVLNGPARGQVWMRSPEHGVGPCAPPRGFAEWLEAWIDGDIAALNEV